jgi:tetratricopeptide (TPR) repeat protein
VLASLLLSGLVLSAAPPDERMVRGMKLHDRGEYAAAIELYRAVLKEHPHDPGIVFEIGMSMVSRQSDYEETIKFVNDELNSGVPQSPRLYLILATAYDGLGDHAKAEDALRRAVKEQPDDPEINFNLGVNLTLQEKWEPASQAFLAAIAKKPDHPTSWRGLAMSYERLNKPMHAMIAWARFATLAPKSPLGQEAAKQASTLLLSRVRASKSGNITVSVSGKDGAGEEVALGLIAAQRYVEKWKDKNDAAFFAYALGDVVQMSAELAPKDPHWKVALAFFEEAKAKGHLDALAYDLRRLGGDPAAEVWLVDNAAKDQKYREWLGKRAH